MSLGYLQHAAVAVFWRTWCLQNEKSRTALCSVVEKFQFHSRKKKFVVKWSMRLAQQSKINVAQRLVTCRGLPLDKELRKEISTSKDSLIASSRTRVHRAQDP